MTDGSRPAAGWALFATPVGRCGIAWSSRGVVAVALPGPDDASTRSSLVARCPAGEEGPPPPAVAAAVEAIVGMLRGGGVDLGAIALDMTGVPPFHRKVYAAARTIPPGETASYGEVAAWVGSPGAARAVGQALRRNPFAIVVPCHRVLAAGGRVGGFSATGGVGTKRRLLALEGTEL